MRTLSSLLQPIQPGEDIEARLERIRAAIDELEAMEVALDNELAKRRATAILNDE